jgi:hypothetical protein
MSDHNNEQLTSPGSMLGRHRDVRLKSNKLATDMLEEFANTSLGGGRFIFSEEMDETAWVAMGRLLAVRKCAGERP